MTWIKNKLLWIAGAISALVFFYLLGRKDGKNAEQTKQKDKAIKLVASARDIDNLSDLDVERLPSKYD